MSLFLAPLILLFQELEPVHTNHLAQETSPYLLQHAHNPVDWYPWDAEALERAKAEKKPILLQLWPSFNWPEHPLFLG